MSPSKIQDTRYNNVLSRATYEKHIAITERAKTHIASTERDPQYIQYESMYIIHHVSIHEFEI